MVGPSAARGLGVTPRGLLATDADATWAATLTDGALTWTRVGAAAPSGRLVGSYLVGPDGVWADRDGWTSLGGGASAAWALPGGELLTYTSPDAAWRLYTPEAGWTPVASEA